MISQHTSQRGQALIVIALGAIALFGIVGLAVDGSMKFSDRRHAQNAADTAVMAAALERATELQKGTSNNSPTTGAPTTCPPPSGIQPSPVCAALQLAGLDRAASNGYDDNHLTNDVHVYNPPISGYYSDCTSTSFDCNDYIQVLIESRLNATFARVLGITKIYNSVNALAMGGKSTSSSLSYDPAQFRAVWSGSSSCTPDFNFNGNNYTINGGIHTNGDMTIPGSNHLVTGISTVVQSPLPAEGGTNNINPDIQQGTVMTDPFASEYTFSRFNTGGDIYTAAGNRIVVTSQSITISWLKTSCYMAGVRCYDEGSHTLQDGIYVTTSSSETSIDISESSILDDDPYDADNWINATFVSQQGGIRFSGNTNKFRPYIGNKYVATIPSFLQNQHGILAASWWNRGGGSSQCSNWVISTSANAHKLQGFIYAPNGQVQLNGIDEDILGCIIAYTALLNGNNSSITCDATWFPNTSYSVGLID